LSVETPVSRSELVELNRKIETMRFGCSLLERKKEALLRAIESDRSTFNSMRGEVEEMLSFVSYAYALVQIFEGESVMTLLSWGIEPREIRIVHHSLMGCSYCEFFPRDEGRGAALAGLLMDPALASLHVDELLETLSRIEPVIWKYINLKAKLDALEMEFEKTRRKVNNLEQEMIPAMESDRSRIRLSLDERERQEAFAVKKLLGKRYRSKVSKKGVPAAKIVRRTKD
jgi:V/A-type H+/Na+-transporting ATPase subunit D